MLRNLLPVLFLTFLLAQGQHTYAALPPEAQQGKEKDAVRESKELRNRSIESIMMYEENETRYYQVDAGCIYLFSINYSSNLLGLLGWVGPQKFNVKMEGKPDCQTSALLERPPNGLQTTIFEFISDIYNVPTTTITPQMSLYNIPSDKKKLGMDFRILALRVRLDEITNCHIETDLFMTIRTVGDLLTLANKHCNSSK
jgi:hypothetical protein